MGRRNRLDVDSFFNEVDQNQELHNLRERVQTLEENLRQNVEREQQLVSEIEEIRSHARNPEQQERLEEHIESLRSHLKQTQGAIEYPVSKIQRNREQPRQTFDEEVEAMQLSLLKEGQLDPVILFEDGMLFDGECRWRAAQLLGWETLEAVFTSQSRDARTLRRKAYLTSLHRRGLNALDKAETLVAIACDEVPGLLPEDVPRIVNRVLTRLKRKQLSLGDRLHLQSQDDQQSNLLSLGLEGVEIQVFLVLLGLQEHPSSLNRNIFPTLSLLEDLKVAVRTQRLGCAQALILNGLSAKKLVITDQHALNLRQTAIAEVTAQNLSASETRQWVADQKKQLLKNDSTRSDSPIEQRNEQVDQVISIVQNLKKEEVPEQQRKELKALLKSVLEQLESMP